MKKKTVNTSSQKGKMSLKPDDVRHLKRNCQTNSKFGAEKTLPGLLLKPTGDSNSFRKHITGLVYIRTIYRTRKTVLTKPEKSRAREFCYSGPALPDKHTRRNNWAEAYLGRWRYDHMSKDIQKQKKTKNAARADPPTSRPASKTTSFFVHA